MQFGRGSGTPALTESWSLDALGNWLSETVNGVAQDDTTNSENELTAADSSSSNQYFDSDGNTLTGSSGTGASATYTYNAWNEMASSTVGGVTTDYVYNALGQRIASGDPSSQPNAIYYYSMSGQVIEADAVTWGSGSTSGGGDGSGSGGGGILIGSGDPTVNDFTQYVWGLNYVNDLVASDTDSVSSETGSTLSSRVYVITDANYDVTGITNTGSAVLERFGYQPYGTRTVMNSSYGSVSDSYSFQVGFQGGLMDPATGLVHFDARDYNPSTGRWMEQDPAGAHYFDGANLYQAFRSDPVDLSDPSGEFAIRLKFDAFIPKSFGQSASDGNSFNWMLEPAQPVSWYVWGNLLNSNMVMYNWFATDDRDYAGQAGTSRIATTTSLFSDSVGHLAKDDVLLSAQAGLSHQMLATLTSSGGIGQRRPMRTARATVTAEVESVTNPTTCSSDVEIFAKASYPFGLYSPDIRFDVTWHLQKASLALGSPVTVSVAGSHTPFPAFEGLANNNVVYSYYPTDPGPSFSNLGHGASTPVTGSTPVTLN